MRHALALSLLLSCFWLVNSGHYTPLILSFMVASVFFVVVLSHAMDVVDGEAQPLHITFRLPVYVIWLAKEVFLANIAVAACVWRGPGSISPRTIRVRASQNTDVGVVIYANSITLTPGTVSIDLEGKDIVVHALTEAAEADLLTGEMDRRVCRVEG
ncbi:MAG: Na+/H+ antiporter subunit E [Desulfofustis sp.]|jgi:multicomponent Na+:H+ antiporter subunit E|nr:Na+/H+ antiporter subunit E [Desulfofustis sp.]